MDTYIQTRCILNQQQRRSAEMENNSQPCSAWLRSGFLIFAKTYNRTVASSGPRSTNIFSTVIIDDCC